MSKKFHYEEYERHERINLNLFAILSAILREQNVSRVAVQLNMSQSSVSATLSRLRELFGDPLLVRGKSRLVPTERALEMTHSLSAIAECVDLMTGRTQGKVEAVVPRKCVISCVDDISTFLVPVITEQILASSSHTTVEFRSMDCLDVTEELEAGRLDTAIVSGFSATPFGHELVGTDKIVCLMNAMHPLARYSHLLRDDYEKAEHVVLSSNSRRPQRALDHVLRDCGVSRRGAVALPYADVIPHLLHRTDLLFTTSRKFASHYTSLLPLHSVALEVDLPTIKYFQATTSTTKDPLRTAWVAAKVRSACADIQVP
ncbi:DNA-binding transcriptional LysR family regulator [Paraburkholderia fungorum]|jgi:DNA-binding transcriptional LysR family regulator|uniref:LysR family transcriptional regulator n=1 Tax=Paraburkholderia fungorum TaxID=134537 RepID=UPI00160AE860|nr:LysR family transcriptional regulator [Paraburkholderia fungorum]MBB4519714.1 DNA-binding transcriptional LysR family regulator [Paraburkholderia fungorum]